MKCPSLRTRWCTRLAVGALTVGQMSLAACAERVAAPVESTEAVITAPIISLTVRDAVERVAPTLSEDDLARELTQIFGQLRIELETGRLSDAALTVASAHKRLQSARAADDGAMTADLTVLALALDDVRSCLVQRKP